MVDLNDNIRNTKPGISVSKSSAADLEMLQNERLKFLHNPPIVFLNISNMRDKVVVIKHSLKKIMQ